MRIIGTKKHETAGRLMQKTFMLYGRPIRYALKRHSATKLCVYIWPEGDIRVSAPGSVSQEQIDAFLEQQQSNILSALLHFPQTESGASAPICLEPAVRKELTAQEAEAEPAIASSLNNDAPVHTEAQEEMSTEDTSAALPPRRPLRARLLGAAALALVIALSVLVGVQRARSQEEPVQTPVPIESSLEDTAEAVEVSATPSPIPSPSSTPEASPVPQEDNAQAEPISAEHPAAE